MRHDVFHVAFTGSMTNRRHLFPEIEPYRTGWLKVSSKHDIYFEECGSPLGKPVLIVHGGPGGGCNPAMRRYHDASRYRIILFDQRGCGRSTPHACLEKNTTWDLVADM
jgi:proline iminopeptidase